MAKGSKKYASHEYNLAKPAKSGVGSNLSQIKAKSHELRKNVQHFDGGGTAQPVDPYGSMTGGGSQIAATIGSTTSVGNQDLSGMSVKFKKGGTVPGKAKVDGDSPKNDTVDAKLSPDEIVVPRSKAKDPKKAEKFVDKEIKKNKK